MKKGFTLIELLLALSISVLVVALLYSSFHTLTSALRGQQERSVGREALINSWQIMVRDLSSACYLAPDDDFVFQVQAAPHLPADSMQLSFCTAQVPPGRTDARWTGMMRVRYEVNEAHELLRMEQPLTGPQAHTYAQTNRLAVGVAALKVGVWYENTWSAVWPMEGVTGLPQRVRVELLPDGPGKDKGLLAEILIPAAMEIQPAKPLK